MRGQAVKSGPWVGTEPGEERQVMGAAEDVDRVQLQQADVVDRTPQVADVDPATRPRWPMPCAASATPRASAALSSISAPASTVFMMA